MSVNHCCTHCLPTASGIKLSPSQQGFSLIELLVVIVIISVFAAVVGMSVGGVEHRRLMQEREQLINDLAVIRLESLDQARVYALIPLTANATSDAGYMVAEYSPDTAKDKQTGQLDKTKLWQPVADFKQRTFSANIYLRVSPLDRQAEQNNPNQHAQALLGREAPRLIWFGNGENKPVQLQMIKDGQPVGSPIFVNSTGLTADTEPGR